MSKEIRDIVAAFHAAEKAGRKTALATIVHVEGSSYRMPGARMLVDDNGCLTGAISGGCLEGDARRRALLAIHERRNRLVTYDTSNEEDVEFGVQLGCNGIVHILFEPVFSEEPDHPVVLLERSQKVRRDTVLVTLFSLENKQLDQPGTCYFFNGISSGNRINDTMLELEVASDAKAVLAERSSRLKNYEGFSLSAFVELIQPPVSLVVVGAGNDAIPLTEMAALLGWEITVVDGRPAQATTMRFPQAKQVIVSKPSEVFGTLNVDARTCFVLMTHNYNYDLELLGNLLQKPCAYVGVLGPKSRLERLLSDLQDRGVVVDDAQRSRVFGPVGIDIGAGPAEEIALSILAEIKAVISGRVGGSLRDRSIRIHADVFER